MAEVVKTDTDQLTATLTVTIKPEDYLPAVNKELNKIRREGSFKGFRKGKTPMSFLRKMFGMRTLIQSVNDILDSEIQKYLVDKQLDIIGHPLPSENQEKLDFNLKDKKDYTFSFDIGLVPEFDLQGLNGDNHFEYFKVAAPEEKVTETLEDIRKSSSSRVSVDEPIEENDIIAINVDELDDEGNIKENGWATTFNILVSDITDDYRAEVIGKQKDEKIRFDIYNFEEGKDRDFVEKYLLNVKENDDNPEIGNMFEGTIADITRLKEAEMDQAFFDRVFGEGEVTSEAEAKDKIRENMENQYDSQANGLLFRDFKHDLLEKNKMALPDAFIRKFIKFKSPDITAAKLEESLEPTKDNLRWSLIIGEMKQQFGLEVSDEDILESFKDRVRGYFGGYGDELIVLNTANRLMEDENQVNQMYEELLASKVFESIRDNVTLNNTSITAEEMEAKLKALQEDMNSIEEETIADTNNDIEDAEVEEEISLEDVEEDVTGDIEEDVTAENE